MIQGKKNTYRIKELKETILKAADSYYNKEISIISDEEYDKLYDELQNLAPNDIFFKTIGAPVDKTSAWEKAEHKISMNSQSKINTEADFKKWVNDIHCNEFVIEDKLDGISINLEYQNDKLVKAITRGDGSQGENIYANVSRMQNVKTEIPGFGNGCLRAEIFLFMKDFEKLNSICKARGENELKNPRNGAAGIAKRLDGKYSEYDSLLYYDVDNNKTFITELQKMEYIESLGLKVCFYKKVNIEEAIQVYNDYEETLRVKTPYDIDELVLKANDLNLQKKLGLRDKRPIAQRAWKFTNMKAESEIQGIEWSNGKNRRITPIAILKSTPIGGVTVGRASLHNLEIFKKFKPGKGDKVLISRRNDVIPAVEEILEPTKNYFEIPTKCPTCNYDLIEDGRFLICPNDVCPALEIGNLHKWVSGLEIKNISIAIITALYNVEKLKEPADFYELSISDIANLEHMGEKSAKKIISHLREKMELTIPEFLGNLNMDQFSTSRVESLVEAGYDDLTKIMSLTKEQICNIQGFQETTAEKIINGLKFKTSIIKRLLEVGITLKSIDKIQTSSNKFQGLSFCFTGAIQTVNLETGKRYKRAEMENLVKENGGNISSVQKGLSYLVMVDPNSNSSKAVKARQLGINILSEEEFFKKIA